MLRSAAVFALVGTAAATATMTYPTASVGCANLGHYLDCLVSDADACAANANCNADNYDEMGCEVSEAIQLVTMGAQFSAMSALQSQYEICGSFTAEDDCFGACAWGLPHGASSAECIPSGPKVQYILLADGADPYTRGYLSDMSAAEVCALIEDETMCGQTPGCAYDGGCSSSTETTILRVNNKCQGSLSAQIANVFNTREAADAEENGEEWTDLTIAQIYDAFGVVDESDATKLAEAAAAKAADAKTKTEAAQAKKEAIPTDDLTEADVAKLDFLAAAAINGQTVKKVVAALDADDADTACATTFEKMDLTSDDGACTALEVEKRRKLLASYSTSVLLDPAKVDETAATAAVAMIMADNTIMAAVTDENPVEEIEAIPNIDATAVADFKTSASTAADANVAVESYEAETVAADAISAAASVAAISALATAALAAAACVFA